MIKETNCKRLDFYRVTPGSDYTIFLLFTTITMSELLMVTPLAQYVKWTFQAPHKQQNITE